MWFSDNNFCADILRDCIIHVVYSISLSILSYCHLQQLRTSFTRRIPPIAIRKGRKSIEVLDKKEQLIVNNRSCKFE